MKKPVRCLAYVAKSVYLCTRFRKNGHDGLLEESGSLKDLQYRQVVQEEKRRRFRIGLRRHGYNDIPTVPCFVAGR